MHTASSMVVPRGAVPPGRSRARPAGNGRISPGTVGLASRAQLLGRGFSSEQLRSALVTGTLRRIAHGWYAQPDHHRAASAALASGFRLTCLDALRMHGIWVPHRAPGSPLHVYRPRNRRPCPPHMCTHGAGLRAWPEDDPVASVPLALQHAIGCLDGESAAIVLESSIASGLMRPADVESLLSSASSRVRSRIGTLSAASESGSETRVVRALRRRGFPVEQQIYVDGAGYIDACAGGLLLEIDGRAHHSSPTAFEVDRARDLVVRGMGLQILRLSYNQVWHSWGRTEQTILDTISHLGRQGRRRLRELTSP